MMQQQQAHKQARDITQISFHKSQEEITKSGANEDEDVLPEFIPFKGKYVSVRAV